MWVELSGVTGNVPFLEIFLKESLTWEMPMKSAEKLGAGADPVPGRAGTARANYRNIDASKIKNHVESGLRIR